MQVRTPVGVRLKYNRILKHYLCAWNRRITIGEMYSMEPLKIAEL